MVSAFFPSFFFGLPRLLFVVYVYLLLLISLLLLHTYRPAIVHTHITVFPILASIVNPSSSVFRIYDCPRPRPLFIIIPGYPCLVYMYIFIHRLSVPCPYHMCTLRSFAFYFCCFVLEYFVSVIPRPHLHNRSLECTGGASSTLLCLMIL